MTFVQDIRGDGQNRQADGQPKQKVRGVTVVRRAGVPRMSGETDCECRNTQERKRDFVFHKGFIVLGEGELSTLDR